MEVSIAMATYNGAKYIQEQLDSLASQTTLPFELVACDDGSTDDTLHILRQFAKSAPFPVRVYQNEKNLGFADNFLRAASLCEAEWIGFCDQDDVWFPTKLATVGAAIEIHCPEELMLVAHSAQRVGHDLKPIGGNEPDFRRKKLVARNKHFGFWSTNGFACIFRGELVRELDWTSRPRSLRHVHRCVHDQWICMLANSLGAVLYIPEPLAYYRRHGASLTPMHTKPNTRQLVGQSRHIGSEHYKFWAYAAEQSAATLERSSTVTKGSAWSKRFGEGAQSFHKLANVCDLRSQIYDASGTLQRLWRVGALFVRGGYLGDRFYALGLLSLLKDLHFCFFGSHAK